VGLIGPSIFYFIFTPLTIYPVFFVIKLLYSSALLNNNLIILNSHSITLIPACIAGAAYYLVLILNLATPMDFKARIKSLLFMFISFLFLNVLRILVFTALFAAGFALFDIAHKATWYLGSTVLVVAIWFSAVYLFKIRNTPVYTDFKTLFSYTKKKGKGKR
jgi:exosortase/archaeosortase